MDKFSSSFNTCADKIWTKFKQILDRFGQSLVSIGNHKLFSRRFIVSLVTSHQTVEAPFSTASQIRPKKQHTFYNCPPMSLQIGWQMNGFASPAIVVARNRFLAFYFGGPSARCNCLAARPCESNCTHCIYGRLLLLGGTLLL